MSKWEYMHKSRSKGFNLDINEFGLQGWELVSVTYCQESRITTYYFKRPLP